MRLDVLSPQTVERRNYWVNEIVKLSGDFGTDCARVEEELNREIARDGTNALFDHLRLCGVIPECYGHDTSEEKLYSKYTDAVLATLFRQLGLRSFVLCERADAADVEVECTDYSFVADAKAFRLSRTAKNQKDFKVQAMDGWKRGKPYAMLVCPLYQLHTKPSQIYQQAGARNVCIFSYSHLTVLLKYVESAGKTATQDVLGRIFHAVEAMNPSKSSIAYWSIINETLLSVDGGMRELWAYEKRATLDAIAIAKEEGLSFLISRRREIMAMSRDDAIRELISVLKIDSKISVIELVKDNNLLSVVHDKAVS